MIELPLVVTFIDFWKAFDSINRESMFAILCHYSLVILKLDLELIATESPFAPNNYLSDPNQHIKSLPKSTRRKIVNLPEHFQLICIISKGLLVCVFWNVNKAQLKINVMK